MGQAKNSKKKMDNQEPVKRMMRPKDWNVR